MRGLLLGLCCCSFSLLAQPSSIRDFKSLARHVRVWPQPLVERDAGKQRLVLKVETIGYVIITRFNNGDVQFYYALSDVLVSEAQLNHYNLEHPLTRAYLDADSDPVLELDYVAADGINPEQLYQSFVYFSEQAVPSFHQYLRQYGEQ